MRSSLASPKRRRSGSVRTNARITRTPVICSRSTWLIRSSLPWIVRNCGTTVIRSTTTSRPISGTATTSRSDSSALSLIAMNTPPTHMIGATTISVSATCRNSWICWMSFVLRVISDGVPNRFISRAGEALHAPEHRAADVRAGAHRDAGGVVHGHDRDPAERERDREHHRAGRPDVVDVALDDAVVDDVGVQVRQIQVPHGLGHEQRDDHRHLARVGAQEAAQKPDQHRAERPMSIREG